jgi:hypothetical protein
MHFRKSNCHMGRGQTLVMVGMQEFRSNTLNGWSTADLNELQIREMAQAIRK